MKLSKQWHWVILLSFLLPGQLEAQIVITAEDMVFEDGFYYKAYSNGDIPIPAAALIGDEGGPRFWDFTDGPKSQIIRYDYSPSSNSIYGDDFPGATLVERSTDEGDGTLLGEIFFENVDGVGRRVYGFVQDTPSDILASVGLAGALPFSSPQIDFPANIKMGDTWTNTLIFETNSDGGLGGLVQLRIIQTDEFEVDAYGFVDLEEIGIVDALRVNTVTKTDVQIRQDEAWVSFGAPSYARIYRWLGKGKGIIAELSSQVTSDLSGNASPPPLKFEVAGKFFRMFETNKAGVSACQDPDSVNDLRITFDVQNGRVFLRWSKVECASFYRVEYSTNLSDPQGWKLLEQTNGDFSLDIIPRSNEMRMYRIVTVLE